MNKSENKIQFLLKGTDHVVANTLRRAMISEVPVLAIKNVTFIKNSSALFDEIVAHRLGLVPLKADLKSFTDPEECNCKGKGCGKCEISFTMNCEGPITVYADALKCSDDGVSAVFPKMPLVKLLKGQELEIEATATVGMGKVHSKYAPCLAYYYGYPSIKAGKVSNAEEVVKSCPRQVLENSGNEVKVKDIANCNLCGACEAAADPEDSVIVEPSKTDFVFVVESWGQMTAEEILKNAIEAVEGKLDGFNSQLSKLK